MSGEYLAPGINEAFDRVERFRNDLTNLKERWDNRLVLERCSLAELYLNGRLEIVLHGDWGGGPADVNWACRIAADITILQPNAADLGIHIIDGNHGNNRHEVVMFVVVVQLGEGPKMFVRSVFRPYLLQKKFFKSGEGLLYRRETGVGWEVFPWRGREIDHLFRVEVGDIAADNALCDIIQCGPEIAESITNDIRQRFWNWLFGPVGQLVIRRGIEINDRTASFFHDNFVEGTIKGRRHASQLINIAVGPLNLYQ